MSGCDGVCVSTAEAIANVSLGLAGVALAFGLGASLIKSFASFVHGVKRHRSHLAQEQSYPPGVDPFFLISTLQFIATLNALDKGQLPASVTAYIERFKWSVFLIDLDTSKLRKTCDTPLRDEAYGAALSLFLLLGGAFFIREILRRLASNWSLYYSGHHESPPFLLAPHWELVVFLIEFLPYNIVAGKMMGSDCLGWNVIGLTAFIFLPLLGCIILHHVARYGLEIDPHVEFVPSKNHKVAVRLENISQFCLPLAGGSVGKWMSIPGETMVFGSSQHFIQIFGKFFESYRVEVWYYGSVVLVKKMCAGLCFALHVPRTAATFLVVIYFSEAVLLAATQPHSEFKLFFRSMIQSTFMCTMASFMLGHVNGEVTDATLAIAVVTIATISLWIGIVDQAVTGWREFSLARSEIHDMAEDSLAEKEQMKRETHRFVGGDFMSRTSSIASDDLGSEPNARGLMMIGEDGQPLALSERQHRKKHRKLEVKKPEYTGLTKTIMDHESIAANPAQGSKLTDTQQRELEGAKARLINLGHWSNDGLAKAEEPSSTQVVSAMADGRLLSSVSGGDPDAGLPNVSYGGYFNRSWSGTDGPPRTPVAKDVAAASGAAAEARPHSTTIGLRSVELRELSPTAAKGGEEPTRNDSDFAGIAGIPLNPFGLFTGSSTRRKSSLQMGDIPNAEAEQLHEPAIREGAARAPQAEVPYSRPDELSPTSPIGKNAADMRARQPVNTKYDEIMAAGIAKPAEPSRSEGAGSGEDRIASLRATYGIKTAPDPKESLAARATGTTIQELKQRLNARMDASRDNMQLLQENVQATAGDVTGETASNVSNTIRQRLQNYKLPNAGPI